MTQRMNALPHLSSLAQLGVFNANTREPRLSISESGVTVGPAVPDSISMTLIEFLPNPLRNVFVFRNSFGGL